ncbi:MAG: restriction endonuclease subunit S [Methanoregula sp.]|uniref:restriction endonuclease subunit S n=1 Tax=Methanoregula sp. TaxID=2052170 RepID=UPI003BB1737F
MMKPAKIESSDSPQFFDESEVPDGWELKKLCEDLILDIQPGFACGKNTRDGQGIPHIRPMNVTEKGQIDLTDLKFVPESECSKPERFVNEGDVIFNNTNSPALVGKTAYYNLPEPRAFSNHMTRLRCNKELIDPVFCAMVLHQKWREGYFKSVCNNHVSQSSVGRQVLLDTQILLPPLAEQQRIVARVEALLSHVNATRERLNRVPLIMKRFREAVLQSAIEGRLVQLDSCEKKSINDEDTEVSLPQSWRLEAIENHVSRLTNGYVGPTRDIYIESGIPYLLARHIKKHKIIFDQRTFISEEFNQKNRKSILKKGDVLVVQSGDIGQTAVVDDDHVGHNCHALIVITPKGESLDGHYLSIYFSSITGQNATRQIQTGITLKHLNCKDVKKIKIPLPTLAEQREIVRRVGLLFERADAIDREVEVAGRRCERLTQAVLGKAFRGELK